MRKKYEKYVVSKADRPKRLYDPGAADFSNQPPLIFLNGDKPIKTGQFLEVIWVYADGVGGATPGRSTHKHDNFDELFIFLCGDHKYPDGALGADVEFSMGDKDNLERYSFNTSTTVFVPRGVYHLPFYFKNVKKPFVIVTVGINAGSAYTASRL
jgi:hypothetical protein